jgi:hypothetical protein
MPLLVSAQAAQDFFPIACVGSAAQYLYKAAEHGLNVAVPNGGQIASPVLICPGMKSIAVGAKSTQGGAINVQRWLDSAGTIPQGAVVTTPLVANTQATLNINDGAPFAAFTVTITNTGGSPATLSLVGVLVQAT